MSNSPLTAAQQLVRELQQQADNAISAQLNSLSKLLADAEQCGEGQEAEGLRQQIQKLIETNAQFVSVMVHEIRVPMTSIRGYADLLANKSVGGELNPMQGQFVETIRSNVIRMEHLVSDISDISKLHSGRMRLESKMDMYKNVAMEVEKRTKDLAAQHNHTLVFDTPSGLPLLNLDSSRLTQVVEKLLVNAIQYTPDGGTITVKAEDAGGHLKVSVIDSGIGIRPEDHVHIGELFWRADDDHVRSFKGHGLGLPIAIGFLRLFNGKFFFESEPGKGSVFGFIVPGMSG